MEVEVPAVVDAEICFEAVALSSSVYSMYGSSLQLDTTTIERPSFGSHFFTSTPAHEHRRLLRLTQKRRMSSLQPLDPLPLPTRLSRHERLPFWRHRLIELTDQIIILDPLLRRLRARDMGSTFTVQRQLHDRFILDFGGAIIVQRLRRITAGRLVAVHKGACSQLSEWPDEQTVCAAVGYYDRYALIDYESAYED